MCLSINRDGNGNQHDSQSHISPETTRESRPNVQHKTTQNIYSVEDKSILVKVDDISSLMIDEPK